MKETLNKLINHEILSKEDAKRILVNIAKGDYNTSQIAAFLTVYMMRSITIEELEGFRDALLDLCLAVDLSAYNPIDLCGTGGDGKDTFNISTLASFVTAGAGVKVTKHGNYGVSSKCGSSNVMEFLGIKLGPMVNPAFPKNQMVGVFNLELARMYGYLYQKTDKNFTVLHALDGYDEISLTGNTKTISNHTETMLKPSDFGVPEIKQTDIVGGDGIESSAQIFKNVLQGKGTEAQNNVVCANAGIAIATVNNLTPIQGFEKAKESLLSGKGLNALKKIQELSKN